MAELHIKRRLLGQLKENIDGKDILIVAGPRQAGKTTIMKELAEFLRQKGEKTLFLNFDYETDKVNLESQDALINRVRLEFGNERGFVFIDEIQRKKNAGLFLKGIYDLGLPYKFIVSGSGSLELKESIHESLAGRKIIFPLGTVDFFEFVDFKTEYKYSDRLPEFFDVEKQKTNMLLGEYLNFGGYPRVVLAQTLEKKIAAINEIFSSVIERDIAGFLGIDRPEAFSTMVKILAAQTGRLIKYSGLAKQIGVSLPIVKKYLWYAQKTFIIDIVPPYFSNKIKEIIKAPVPYFIDLGLCNFAAGSFGAVGNDRGFVFQNLVKNILDANLKPASALRFWRTNTGAEVDFVIVSPKSVVPIEVKFADFERFEMNRSLISFVQQYRPQKAIVVNKSFTGSRQFENTKVLAVPFYLLSANF